VASTTQPGAIMIYLLKVNMLVAAAMFGLAGLFIAGLFVWTEARKYAQAFRPIQRAGGQQFL